MKIRQIDELALLLKSLRKEQTIVCVNGSFDILHVGHIRALQEAKSKGDVLIVLLNSDISIRRYKGSCRPIVAEHERAELLSALECVDYIVLFDDLTPLWCLEVLKPDIFCNGSDYGKNCIERKTVENYGGRVAVLSWQASRSTSALFERIRKAAVSKRAVFFDRDNTIIQDPNGYIHKTNDFAFAPRAIDAMRLLSGSDYLKIIITDQSGIGRGYYTEDDYHQFTSHMLSELSARDISIDRVYHCPHTPNDGCTCRKPGAGLFLRAVEDFDVSLANSWYIGDKARDVIAGRMANLKTVKLLGPMPAAEKLEPDYYAADLFDAVRHIITLQG